MESPFDIIKNIGKNIVKTGKQAVTDAYSGQGAFAPDTNLGIARNTITGLKSASSTVGQNIVGGIKTAKETLFPNYGYDLMNPIEYQKRLGQAKTQEDRSVLQQKYKAQQPSIKDISRVPFRMGAQIATGLGNIAGQAFYDKPFYTKESLLGRIAPGGAGRTLGDVAQTRFGQEFGNVGKGIEQFSVPKTSSQAYAQQLGDIFSALPIGSVKAVKSFKDVSKLIAKSTDAKVIANELKNVGIVDAVIPRISSSLAKETNPKVVEKVIQKMDNLYRGVAPEVAKTISPDDIKVMKLFINDIRQAKDVPFEGQRIISKDGKYAYDLMEKWNINTEQDANKIATIFEDILTGNRKVTATLLAKPKPIDDIIFQAKAIVKDGKKVVTEKPRVAELDDPTKYKTAEEFVKAKGEKVFSGAGEEVKVWNESASRGGGTVYRGLNEWGDGIYVTDSPNYAKTYGTKTTESIVKPNLKLFDVRDSANISEIQKTKIISAFKEQYGKSLKSGFTQDITKALKEADNPKEFFDVLQNEVGTYTTDVLKKAGFDGIIANESKMNGGNIVGGKVYNIFDPKNIQTKSQLTDIWNKANETKQPRDTIGRFDVKPKPTLSEELMAKMSKPKPVVPVYQGEKDLTVKTLEKLKGRSTVSKQFISDLTNSADLKQSERDLIREALATEKGDTINVTDFAKKVKAEVLPLKLKKNYNANYPKSVSEGGVPIMSRTKFESISLPSEIRGRVKNYDEHLWESPIKTSAGQTHFPNEGIDNYFGHTRIEDMADNKIRRVIEVQSDLYQKGRLDSEFEKATLSRGKESRIKRSDEGTTYDATKDFNKLQQYNDPTAHFRMVREEVKKAAQDGKTKLQFPTGETAMKIEGLGSRNNFELYDEFGENLPLEEDMLKVGKEIKQGSTNWIITNVLGDGKFVAVQKNTLDRLELQHGKIKDLSKIVGGATETFDISGKVDTNNPIYKFYEKEVGRYLANKYKAKLVTDAQGVKWWEVDINPAMGKAPVEAFGAVAGVEVDENGKVSFDPIKAGLGFAGFTAYNKIKKIMPVDRLIADGKIKINRVGTRDVYSYKKGNMWQRARDESSAIRAVTSDLASMQKEASILEEKAKTTFNEYWKKNPTQQMIDSNNSPSTFLTPDEQSRLQDLTRNIENKKLQNRGIKSQSDFIEVVQLKRTLRKRGIMFDNDASKSELKRLVDSILPQALEEKKIAIEIQKEAIKDSQLNSLIKYTAKTGENKGRLPEVLGGAGTKGFAKKGDDFVTEALGRNVDSETARQELETFMQRKQQVLAQEKAVNEEIKAFKATQTEIKPKVTPKPEAPRPSSPVQAITGSTGEVRSLEKMAEQSATREILDPQLRKSSSLPKIIEKTATNVKSKVNALDYLRTPDKVLKKIGLENSAVEIRRGYDAYVKELPKNINKITEWSKRVSKEGNVKIFKYLDGEAIDLNPEELKVANEIKTWLAQWANRLGLPQDNRIANYITHLFDNQLIAKEFDEDLAKIIADKVPSSVYDPFLLKRLGAKGYKQDTWSALDAYVKRGTRKVHMDAPLSNLEDASRGLEESQWNYVKRFADRVNMRPTEFDNIIDNGIKSLIGYRFGQRPVTTIARTLRQATYRGMLGLNVGSALRNLSQGINTYAKLGEKYTVVGYSKLFSPKNLAELAEEGVLSPGFIQDRAMSSTKKFMEKADKVLFALFDTAEKINRGAAYFGAKAKGIAEGMTEAKAIEYAKKIVRETQFAFGSIDTPVGMSSDIVKTLTQFQTFTTKQIEFLAEMAKNKEYAGLIRYGLSGLAFVYTVGQAFGMKKEDLAPIYRLGIPPSLRLPWEGVKAIAGAKDKYGNERTTSEKVTDVAETLPGYIPGGIQAKKTIQGAKAIQEGGVFDRANRMQFEGPETKAQQVQAILFGKYSSQKAKDYFDKTEGKELEKIKPVYDQVQKLKEAGDMVGGQAIIDSLTDEQYEMYKKVKSSETTKKNAEIKKSMYPVYNDVQKLKTAGNTAEVQKIIDGLTDDEYKAYQSIKKDKESKPTTPEYDQNIVSRYVEAVVKDPSNTLKALFTKEKLGKVEGNLVELQRFYGIPFTDVGGSQEYKKKRMTEMGLDWDTEQKNYKLEHIVPVSAGGSNADSNLVPINNVEHNIYTPVDIALGEAVKQGKITRKRATELARGLKVTKILSIEDIIKLLE